MNMIRTVVALLVVLGRGEAEPEAGQRPGPRRSTPNIGAAQREKAMNRSGLDRKAGAGIMRRD